MRDNKLPVGFFLLCASLVIVFSLISFINIDPGSAEQPFSTWWQFLPLVFKQSPVTQTPTPIPSPTPIVPTPVGPVGGTFTSLAVDPNQNDNLYAGHYGSGVYKSFDKGETWYLMSSGLDNRTIQSLATHPSDTNIVYAGTHGGGVYKSTNAGNSWSASNGGVIGNHIVYDIEIDPTNPNRIYIATRISGSLVGYVYKSTNAGASWTLIFKGDVFNTPDYFYDIDIDPFNSNYLYLSAHEHGFYKSTNAGQSFFAINNGVTDLSARSFSLDPANPGLVYAGVWHGAGVYRSWNGGSSWVQSSSGLPTGVKVMEIYLDPFGHMQKRIFACTFGNGLYSSDNFAQNWSSRGLAGQMINDMLVTDGNPQRWYVATQSNGIFRSNNYGSSWKTIIGQLSLNAISAITGDTSVQFAAVYGKGVYQLDQGGTTWSEISLPFEDKTVVDIAMKDGSLMVLTQKSVFEQTDHGWLTINLPTGRNAADLDTLSLLSEKIGVSPEVLQIGEQLTQDQIQQAGYNVIPNKLEVIDSNTYLLTFDNGLYLRVGERWESVGFEEANITSMALNPKEESLFASVCEPEKSCRVFKEKNGAWLQADSGLDGAKVEEFLFTGESLFTAAETGLYIWETETQSWKLAQATNEPLLSLTQSGCNLAAGGVGMLLFSQDCGKTWAQVNLEDSWHYQALSFTRGVPGQLILGTRETGAALINID